MKRPAYMNLILLLFNLLTFPGLSACQSGEGAPALQPPNFTTHTNSRFNFSVDIPDNWNYTVNGTENYEATATREADPTAGVDIQVESNPDQIVSVYGQVGTLIWTAEDNTAVENIVTQSGLAGKKYTSEHQNAISIQFVFDQDQLSDQGFNTRALGASIRMSKSVYEQNKNTIDLIIQSIRIT